MYRSLKESTGLDIVDILGYFSTYYGNRVFAINRIVLSNGTKLAVDGEHDIAYVYEDDITPLVSETEWEKYD